MPTVGDAVRALLDSLQAKVDAGKTTASNREYYRWQSLHVLDVPDLLDLDLADVRSTHLLWTPKTVAFVRFMNRLLKHARLPKPEDDDDWGDVPAEGKRTRIVDAEEFRLIWQASAAGSFARRRRLARRRAASKRGKSLPDHPPVSGLPWLIKAIHNAGLRPREARELDWLEVREDRRILELRDFKGIDQRRDGLRAREIPLTEDACRLYAYLRRKLRPDPSDKVFLNSHGEPWTCQSLRRAVRRSVVAAGLEDGREHITAYTFRHTFATNFIRGGEDGRGKKGDIASLKEILGHTDITMTQRYLHLTRENKIAALDAAFPSGRKSEAAGLEEVIAAAVAEWMASQSQTARVLAARGG